MDFSAKFSIFLCIFLQLCFDVEMKTFRFANYYGNHMVLQMAPAQARVWGYGKDGSQGSDVVLQMAGKRYTTQMQAGSGNGPTWQVDLDPISSSGPFDITVTNDEETIRLTDVLFGEVWICGGQSNMDHRLSRIFEPQEEIDDSVNYPNVRTFSVARRASPVPHEEVLGVRQEWTGPRKETIQKFSAVCWLFGKHLNQQLQRPIGLVDSCVPGSWIQSWMTREALASCNNTGDIPTQLWNAMMLPLLPMNIRGFLWYQGETNALLGKVSAYEGCLESMISDYRKRFNRKGQDEKPLPWGIVQLAPFRNNPRITTGYTDVRWAQTFSHGYLPNPKMNGAFLAVAMDLPDFFSPYISIHPRFKRKISERLARGALSVVYGHTGRFKGPFPTGFNLHDKLIDITYYDGKVELVLRNATGFELCCSKSQRTSCERINPNAEWIATTVTAVRGALASLTVPCAAGEHVMGIRYGWKESPCELERCALYSEDFELPAPPFIKHGLLI